MLGAGRRTHAALLAALGVAVTTAIATPAWASSFGESGWGFNRGGQLGDESNLPSDVPVAVKGLSGVVSVSGGGENSMALLSDGTVMGFGVNGVGELCDGTHTKADVPVQVGGVSEAAALAVGGYHSLILLTNGTVMDCGGNHYGQLGNGTMGGDFNVAKPVPGLSAVSAVAAQGDTSLALLSNGTVMAWGANEAGQLGDGTTTATDTPVPVRGLSEVSAIAAGTSSLALLRNGTVMSWGENRYGQLGDGEVANSDVPVPVSGLHGVSAVSSGSGFDLALLGDGLVMSWGANYTGQLGDGNIVNSDLAVPVSGLGEVVGIAATSGNDSFAYGPSTPSVAAPVIAELSANQGPASGGAVLTIAGSDFTGATAVRFGSTSALSFTVESDTSITAVTPAEPVGRVNVSVATPTATSDPQGADVSYLFRPSITRLAPSSGPASGGGAVTITGGGFVPGRTGTSFEFGSTKATSVSCSSPSTCVAVAPAHAAGVTQVLAFVGGVGSAKTVASKFTYR